MAKKSIIREIFDSAKPGSINLGLGELQFPMPDYLTSEAIQVISNEKIGYTPNAGLIESREHIAQQYDDCSAQHIVLTSGAEEAIYATFKTLLTADSEILIPDPGFSAYKTIAEMVGSKAVPYLLDETDNFSLNTNSVKEAISPNTRAIVINNPSNPTGTALTTKEINFLVKIATRHNLFIISDEIYRELYIGKRPQSLSSYYSKAIVISGLSKSHCMTGWRLGWVVAPKDIAATITITHQYITTCAPYISQRLASIAFSDEGEIFLKELRVNLRLNLHSARELLKSYDICQTDAGPYLFFNVGTDGYSFAKKLVKKGVIVIPGVAFSSRLSNYIRISYSLPMNELVKGLNLLLKELADIQK